MNKKISSLLALGVLFAGCTCNKPVSVVDIAAPGSVQDFISCVGDRVYFEYDMSNLSHCSIDTICKASDWLHKYDYSVEIVGHCDDRGELPYNIALGERRASAVKKQLIKQGISKDRIRISSVGNDRLICKGKTEEDRRKNRCAVMVLLKGGCPVAEHPDKKEMVTLETQPQD